MNKALVATLLFCTFYGLQIVTQKLFIKSSIHPLHLNFLTVITSFILLTTYFLIFNRKIFHFQFNKNKKIPLLIFLSSVTWIAADLSSIFGLKISSSINFSILSRLQTFITYFCAVIFLKEALKKNKVLAICLSFIGSVIVVYNFQSRITISPGDLLFIAFALLISISGLIRQQATKDVSPFQLSYLMYGISSIVLGLITFVFLPISNINIWLFIVFNAIIGLLGFNLVNYAISQGGASLFSVTASLLPVFTALFSFIILKQLPTINQIIGAIIVSFGVFLFQSSKKK